MKFTRFFRVLICFFLFFGVHSAMAQETANGGKPDKQKPVQTKREQRRAARKKWKEQRKQEKMEKKAVKKKQKQLQTKKVQKRMKKDKRKAMRNNAHKREFFLKRWFSKKQR